MSRNSFTGMSNEKLLKNAIILKIMLWMLTVAAVILLGPGIYMVITQKKGTTVFLVIPMSIGAIIMVNANSLRTIRQELKRSNL